MDIKIVNTVGYCNKEIDVFLSVLSAVSGVKLKFAGLHESKFWFPLLQL